MITSRLGALITAPAPPAACVTGADTCAADATKTPEDCAAAAVSCVQADAATSS